MKYLVGREEKEIVLADGLSVSFIRKEDNETYIDKMPGSRRVLSVADGNVVVSHEGKSVENAKAGTDVIIEGDGSAKIFGKFHGISLSAREDIPCHTVAVDIVKERKALELPEEAGREGFVQVLTASGGYAVVTFEGDSLMLENGETLAVSFDSGEAYDIGVMGQGRVMVSTFSCPGTFEGTAVSAAGAAGETGEKAEETVKQEDVSPEDKARKLIKEKKASRRKISLKGATFADFITALKISSTNNSLGRRISRFRKENWLDPEIRWEIDKLSRKHINAIIWVVVLAVIMAVVGVQTRFITFLPWAVVWTLIDLFIIAPLTYLLVMPKPVSSHIKKLSDLTEEEKKIRQKELDSDVVYHKKRVLKRF